MSLYESFYPIGAEVLKVPTRIYAAYLGEYTKGYATRQEIIIELSLPAEAEADLDKDLNALDSLPTMADKEAYIRGWKDAMYLADRDKRYNTKETWEARLGY